MSYISGGTLEGVLRLQAPATTPALSVAGEGRIYFDGTQFQASQNGAAYTPVVGGGGGGGGWTDDGTVVRLTTATDQVGIGTASPAVGSKLQITSGAFANGLLVSGGTISCPGAGAGSERFGIGTTAAGVNAIAVGNGATAGFDRSVVFGEGATATTTDQYVLGGCVTLLFNLDTDSTPNALVTVRPTDATPASGGTGSAILLRSGAGDGVGPGGAMTVVSGQGIGDSSSSGVAEFGSGTADFGTTGAAATGAVTIRSGAFTGTTNDQGDSTGDIQILVGNGVSLTGDNATGGSVTLSAGSTTNDNATSGSVSINAGGAAGTNSTGGSMTLAAGGGYTSGSLDISTQTPGPGGGGNISISCGGDTFTIFGEDTIYVGTNAGCSEVRIGNSGASSPAIQVTNASAVTIAAPTVTINGNDATLGTGSGNVSMQTQNGTMGGDSTRLFITPNLGIILEIGNTIKVDPDGTNNWIYGDDATVAATPGEPLTLRGGAGNTTGAGGELRLRGGAGGATGAGSNAVIAGGAGGATSGAAGGVSISGGTPVDGNGGSIAITGSNGVGTNRNGGNITLTPGAATGSGTPGATFVTGVLNLDAAIYTGGITYSGGSSYLLANRLVDPQSGDLTLTDQTSRTVYTNEGAAANITLTLPAAVAGLSYTFFVRETGGDSLIIQAGAGDTIRVSTSVSTAGGTAESNVSGDCITLVAINSTEWVAISVIGTWSVA